MGRISYIPDMFQTQPYHGIYCFVDEQNKWRGRTFDLKKNVLFHFFLFVFLNGWLPFILKISSFFQKLHHAILNKSFQFLTKNPLNFTSFIRIYATFSQRNFQFGTSELKILLTLLPFSEFTPPSPNETSNSEPLN